MPDKQNDLKKLNDVLFDELERLDAVDVGNEDAVRLEISRSKVIESQLMGMTLAQLKPLRSTVFLGSLGGASSKASVVGEMGTQMEYWWRNAPHLADKALDAIAETVEAL